MATYSDALTVRDARAEYFAANGFGEGGYADRWVKLQAGPIPLYFPNTAARVAAVRLHDIHHVVTGYETTWAGEAEIAAWEIASSCAHHWAAWLLNLQAMAIGLCIAPRAVLAAFVRGRQTSNLYRDELGEGLLSSTVGALRRRLRLEAAAGRATVADLGTFTAWSLASIVALLVTIAVTLAPIALVSTFLFS